MEEVKFLAKYHEPLKIWLEKHPGNASYLSKTIQNELLEVLCKFIKSAIADELKENAYYTVQCDEVSSHKREFMSVVLRYIYQNEIRERLIALKKIPKTTGRYLSGTILTVLEDYRIRLSKMIGKSFDGASNMSGEEEGVQKHLTDAGATFSEYFHCFGHCLNLVLGYAAEKLDAGSAVFDVIGTIYNIFRYPARHTVFSNYLKNFKICEGRVEFCSKSDTRWQAREDNLRALLNTYPAVIASLEFLKDKDEACRGLLTTLGSIEFICKVKLLQKVFSITRTVSEYLQKVNMDLVTAVDSVESLKKTINDIRNKDNHFESLIEESVKLGTEIDDKIKASELDINTTIVNDMSSEPAPKRRRVLSKRLRDGQTYVFQSLIQTFQTHIQDSEGSVLPGKHYFKVHFFTPFLDIILSQLNARFSKESCNVIKSIDALNPEKWNASRKKDIAFLARKYELDPEVAYREYTLLSQSKHFSDLVKKVQELKGKEPVFSLLLGMFKNNDLQSVYSTIYKIIIIAASLPVTTATCEQAHCKVKLVNNYMRAAMHDDRLEHCIMISCERDLAKALSLEPLVTDFALKPRKIPL